MSSLVPSQLSCAACVTLQLACGRRMVKPAAVVNALHLACIHQTWAHAEAHAAQQPPVQRSIEPPQIPPRPDVKMKSFFWKKIMPYALLNQPTISYWEQRPDLIGLDFDSVTQLFRAKLAAKKSAAAAAPAASATLAVLDVKRATSVGVLMSKLHLPQSKLAKAVFELDDKVRSMFAMLNTWGVH